MKAIILAAGEGKRLKKYTQNLPKCMLNIDGKSLLERQIETLNSCAIKDITIVKGYMGEKITLQNVKYYTNIDYADTNMVATLFSAEQEMNSELLVCYGDIIYEKRVLEEIISSTSDIGIVVDTDYFEYWRARLKEWEEDLETLEINTRGEIVELGKPTRSLKGAAARYVGLIKFSEKGLDILKEVFRENKERYWHKEEKWLNSKSFKKAYMTDMLQAIIDKGEEVHPIKIKRGWLEFDTEEDYEKVQKWISEGAINKFISL
ncbi:MAG: phosphocholine cytidylyltransferase family protein [Nanoarchaeota archaeon]|mgnify:CR=1 FL=1